MEDRSTPSDILREQAHSLVDSVIDTMWASNASMDMHTLLKRCLQEVQVSTPDAKKRAKAKAKSGEATKQKTAKKG